MTQTTAIEFLHTFKREGQAVQVQAALYYLKHYQSKPRARVSEVVQVLVEARVRNAKKVNWRRALASSAPFARSVEYGVWEITGTGERKLTDEYGVKPAAAAGPPQAIADDLAAIISQVPDRSVRGYLEEAAVCLAAGGRRAFVVFVWSGAVWTIREQVWRFGSKAIHAALQQHNPRAKFRKKGDFEALKDSDLLQLAHDLEIFDKSQKKRLTEALDLRNDCGHPVEYHVGDMKAHSFLEDVVATVWPRHEESRAA
jgi:hypothetical protein